MRRLLILFAILSQAGLVLADDSAAMRLVEQARAFVGGDAVDAVRTVRLASTQWTYGPTGKVEVSVGVEFELEYPDSIRTLVRQRFSTLTQVVTPTTAYVTDGKRRAKLTATERDLAFLAPDLEPLTVLKHASRYAFIASGAETIDGIRAAIIDISANNVGLRWWIDPETGRLVRSSRTMTGQQRGTYVTDYRAWKTFNGVSLPTASSRTRDGKPFATHSITKVEIITATPAAPGATVTTEHRLPPNSTPQRPANICDTSECSILVRIMKADGEPCAQCPVEFSWSGMGFGTGGDATRLTNARGFVEFRSPERYLFTIATIVNRTGLILPLRRDVDTLGGSSLTITTPYTGR